MTENVPNSEESNAPKKRGRKPKTPIPVEEPKETFLKKVEKNLPILEMVEKSLICLTILLPLLGSCSQIYSLSKIGPEYLRFFSISQLASDSLTFMEATILSGIPQFFLGVYVATKFSDRLLAKVIIDSSGKILKILFLLVFPLSLYASPIVVFNFIKDSYNFPIVTKIYFIIMYGKNNELIRSFGIFLTGTCIILVFLFLNKIMLITKEEKEKKGINSPFDTLIVPFSFFLIFVVFLYIYLLFNSLITPTLPKENFKNYTYIYDKYDLKKEKITIPYFNDQYVFVEINKHTLVKYNNAIYLNIPQTYIEVLSYENLVKKGNP